ncbi:Low temperature requirement protein A [Streptococcus mitis]|uniref:Low temperature requirement protein A n=1 Tax=Streptococcus mitis TaxID=28037 RepID=A0A150NGB5_STRMT|nr:Low temperature requirement protein A [Streptococcus mitis]
MTTLIKHKRVEFSELFYDLVFVFAISKVTTLIDHLHNGILTWNSFLDFFHCYFGSHRFLDDSNRLYQSLWKELFI